MSHNKFKLYIIYLLVNLTLFKKYIGISASHEDRWFEHAGALHEHFISPIHIKNGNYMPPTAYGYSSDMRKESILEF